MKKNVLIILFVFIIFGLVICGCSTEQEPVKPEQTGDAQGEPEEVFHLKYSDWSPEIHNVATISKEALEMIEERSNGRVKITPYFAGSLLEYSDVFMGVSTGAADIVRYVSTMSTGVHDLNLIYNRLFEVEAPDVENLSKVYRELLGKVPEIQKEMEQTGARWLTMRALLGSNLHTANKAVRVPDDIRGMKILCTGENTTWISSMNGASVTMPQTDWYMSLERGIAEGEVMHWSAIDSYKRLEVLNYHTLFGANGTAADAMGYLINLETWNSLPSDIQEIIIDAFQWATDKAEEVNINDKERIMAEAKEKGNTFIELTPEEMQLWAETMKPINEKWITETEAKGWPAEEAFNELISLFEEYR